MAKVKLNPILTGVHGHTGGIVFYCRKNREYLRAYTKGRNPDTEAQRTVRRTFAGAVRSWQAMTQAERSEFNRKARNMNMSGYNLHISQYMKARISAALKPDLKRRIQEEFHLSRSRNPDSSVSPPFIKAFTENMPGITVQSGTG